MEECTDRKGGGSGGGWTMQQIMLIILLVCTQHRPHTLRYHLHAVNQEYAQCVCLTEADTFGLGGNMMTNVFVSENERERAEDTAGVRD